MESGLYTIIEFDPNDKWFVIGQTTYQNENYNYLIKITPDEQEFIEDYMIVKCTKIKDEEYFDIVKDKELLKKITPLLMPAVQKILKNPNQALKELIKY